MTNTGHSLKEFSLSHLGPDETEMKALETTHCCECFIPTDSEDTSFKKKLRTIRHIWTDIKIKIAPNPFAQGGQRITYHGKWVDVNKYGQQEKYIVLKEFKYFGMGRDRREEYMGIMETQFTAAILAAEFNKLTPGNSKDICFLPVSKIVEIILCTLKFAE